MLRSWPTKIPNMNKIQQKTNDQLRTQDLGTDKGIPVYPPLCEWGYNYIYMVAALVFDHLTSKSVLRHYIE